MFNGYGGSYPMQSSYSQIAGQTGQTGSNGFGGTGGYGSGFSQNTNNQPVYSQQTNITFVNGIEGAKAFQMAPNSSALLMDSDNSKFYVKNTDNLGMARISRYSFTEDVESEIGSSGGMVTIGKEEYDALVNRLSDLENKTTELTTKLGEVL